MQINSWLEDYALHASFARAHSAIQTAEQALGRMSDRHTAMSAVSRGAMPPSALPETEPAPEEVTEEADEWSRNVFASALDADKESEAGQLFTALQAAMMAGQNGPSEQSLDASQIGQKMIEIVRHLASQSAS